MVTVVSLSLFYKLLRSSSFSVPVISILTFTGFPVQHQYYRAKTIASYCVIPDLFHLKYLDESERCLKQTHEDSSDSNNSCHLHHKDKQKDKVSQAYFKRPTSHVPKSKKILFKLICIKFGASCVVRRLKRVLGLISSAAFFRPTHNTYGVLRTRSLTGVEHTYVNVRKKNAALENNPSSNVELLMSRI